MTDLFSLLQMLPTATKLYNYVQRAQKGDTDALDYLKREGWIEALDAVRPGAGQIGKRVYEQGQEAYQNIRQTLNGNVIEGEFREVFPWQGFVRWMQQRDWGVFVILGPKGQGKSTLALRLAEVWHHTTGYPVTMVMGYPEDLYDFVTPVSTQQFVRDIRAIIRILDPRDGEAQEVAPDDSEGEEEFDPEEIDRKLNRFKRRIIVVDEMSLTVGTSGADAGRLMVRQLMAQARHLNLLICYIGQLAKMLPNDLLNSEAIFVKKPNGREIETDREDRLTRLLWRDAMQTFTKVPQLSAWGHYPDIRAWAHVECLDMGKGHGYRGPVPFSLPGRLATSIVEEART